MVQERRIRRSAQGWHDGQVVEVRSVDPFFILVKLDFQIQGMGRGGRRVVSNGPGPEKIGFIQEGVVLAFVAVVVVLMMLQMMPMVTVTFLLVSFFSLP